MTDLVDTTEMYLRTILDLEEEAIIPLRARISERLGHSGPTVSQTIARMERDGLVVVSGDRHLELTTEGRSRATHVMRKHRLAERLLSDVIGLDWAFVHDEACRWEHVMSEQVEVRLLEMLGNPTESPYGNPIPGLAEIGGPDAGGFLDGVQNIVTATEGTDAVATGTIRRLGEPVQFEPELLHQLRTAGSCPVGSRACSARAPTSRCGSTARTRASSSRARSHSTCTSNAATPDVCSPLPFCYKVPVSSRQGNDCHVHSCESPGRHRTRNPWQDVSNPSPASIGNDDERMGFHGPGQASPQLVAMPRTVVTRRRRPHP